MDLKHSSFYGDENETYYVNNIGEIYCVQSVDALVDGHPYPEVQELPEGMQLLPMAICHDLDISGLDSEMAS